MLLLLSIHYAWWACRYARQSLLRTICTANGPKIYMQKRWIIIGAVNLHLDDDGDLVWFNSAILSMVKSKFELNVHLHCSPMPMLAHIKPYTVAQSTHGLLSIWFVVCNRSVDNVKIIQMIRKKSTSWECFLRAYDSLVSTLSRIAYPVSCALRIVWESR